MGYCPDCYRYILDSYCEYCVSEKDPISDEKFEVLRVDRLTELDR